jgi:IS5 family transposase
MQHSLKPIASETQRTILGVTATPEARVGRAGKGYQLGYKLHLAVDASSELPLAVTAAPANENEKKPAPKLVEKAVKASNGQTKVLVADSQYSSRRLRKNISCHGIQPIIPYPSNQKPAEAKFLRVDKRFRAHGPESLKKLYAYKASAERNISRLKQHLSLENHKARGLRNILTHALICISAMLLTALTAIKLRRPEQIRAITALMLCGLIPTFRTLVPIFARMRELSFRNSYSKGLQWNNKFEISN